MRLLSFVFVSYLRLCYSFIVNKNIACPKYFVHLFLLRSINEKEQRVYPCRWWLPIETNGGGYWSFKFLNYTEIGEEFS
jgi:hypothetical protein